VHTAVAYDGLTGLAAEAAGFELIYLSGNGVAGSRGFPDVGLTTLSEMLDACRSITYAVQIPLLCDADTGYGNAINVQRTVREFERAGAAGLHLEDQEFPKKCGFMAGKRVISVHEHSDKIRAACDARRDDDFIIIGRTDALAVNGWDDVVERANAYVGAGADLIMVDGIRTKEDVQRYVDLLVSHGVSCILNGEAVALPRAREFGFRMHLTPAGFFEAYETLFRALRKAHQGSATDVDPIPTRDEVLGLAEIYEVEARYTDRETPEDITLKLWD
jgi:2-methylisocitrate lyase-like PEP mutase family enzyme